LKTNVTAFYFAAPLCHRV